MKSQRAVWILLCLPFLSNVGCSSKPVEQQASAQRAFDQAKEQHAEDFASVEWKEAMKVWSEAETAAAKGNYASAGELYQTAKSRFDKAYNVAKARREVILRDVQGLQGSIDDRYKDAKDRLSKAKLSSKSKKEIEGSFEQIDQAIAKLKEQVDQGNYTQAKAAAEAILRQVYEVGEKIRGRR